MEVTVISSEMIKPSTPTPPPLRRLKLSLIDQHIPSTIFVRLLLFYSSEGLDVSRLQTANMARLLKKSLSEVLTEFYPLAGTVNNNQWIDCDDHGLEYIEARVRAPGTLDQLLSCPKAEELDRLVPHDAYAYKTGFKGLSAVQVTVFEGCGSMAVGVSLSHIIIDASSLGVFIDSWARIARGGENTLPKFDFGSLFPPRDIPAPQTSDQDTPQEVKKLVVKRFVFPQSKIDLLKAKFKHQRPSKIQVLSALIFKVLIKVCKASTPLRSISPGIAMNLRGRMSPPLSVHCVGNMIFPLMIEHATPEMSLNDLGRRLRELIEAADGEYMKKLQANGAALMFETLDGHYKLFGESRVLQVSSWCRFPFYKADFGWGGPAWVAPVYLHDQDCCVMVDTKDGAGVEAWMILEEEDMKQFDTDPELVEYICPN